MGRTIPHLAPSRAGARLAACLTLGALALTPALAGAQVVINEILPNPNGDDVGTERIEIYNAGLVPVDVTGWAIDDAAIMFVLGLCWVIV
jgi:hypothetical protein